MRVVRVARASARKARTQALNQMRSIISTAPEAIRAELRHLNVYRLIERASAYRPGKTNDLEAVTKRTLRMLARRAAALEEEVKEIDEALEALVSETAPALVARTGVGTDTASALLVAAGDNSGRLRSEATFAHLCGASPIDASSGKQQRHRLNRGGDRQANSALWKIVITRMVCDPPTRAYIERRVKDGLTKKEAIRCLIGRVSAGGPSRLVRGERRGTASMSCHWMACLSWSPSPLVGPRDRHERPAPQRAEQ
jgi:transposase